MACVQAQPRKLPPLKTGKVVSSGLMAAALHVSRVNPWALCCLQASSMQTSLHRSSRRAFSAAPWVQALAA